jgi:hypothetical protein
MQEDLLNFEKWLRARQLAPSICILSQILKAHGSSPISLYTVKKCIEELKLDSDITPFRATVYLHNQYFPCFTESEIQTILECYKTNHYSDEHHYWTFEAILTDIGQKCTIDINIQSNECPICLDKLGWEAVIFDACFHAYCETCNPTKCIICK